MGRTKQSMKTSVHPGHAKKAGLKTWEIVIIVLAVGIAICGGGVGAYVAIHHADTPPAQHAYLVLAKSTGGSTAHGGMDVEVATGLRTAILNQDTTGAGRLASEKEVKAGVQHAGKAGYKGSCVQGWVQGGGVLQYCDSTWSGAVPNQTPPQPVPSYAQSWLLLNAPNSTDAKEMLETLNMSATEHWLLPSFVSAANT